MLAFPLAESQYSSGVRLRFRQRPKRQGVHGVALLWRTWQTADRQGNAVQPPYVPRSCLPPS